MLEEQNKRFIERQQNIVKKNATINNTHPCYTYFSSYPLCDHNY